MPTHADVQAVFRQALGLSPDAPVATLEYQGVPEWDSVAHMTLVAMLERAFEVMLETDEILDMSSYTVCVRILEGHGVAVDDS